MHTMSMLRGLRPTLALVLLALGGTGQAVASGPGESETVEPAYRATSTEDAPWLQPIAADRPIRRMTALKTEYRRIRDLRRTQIQPEYERRVAEGDDADAWREATLREVARRDLRDLRARLER